MNKDNIELVPVPSLENITLHSNGKFKSFKAKAIIDHLGTELEKFASQEQRDYTIAHDLLNEMSLAENALDSLDINCIATRFYLMGVNANKLESGLYGENLREVFEAARSHYATQIKNSKIPSNINKRNKVSFVLRNVGIDIAQEKWGKDPSIRTGDMATLVWEALFNFIRSRSDDDPDKKLMDKMLPNQVNIKRWFKDIAPEEAKKGGRPSK